MKFSSSRFGKMVNWLRSNKILPVIGTSDGYFVSRDKDWIEIEIKSLEERINSIKRAISGLEKMIDGDYNELGEVLSYYKSKDSKS